MEWLRIVFLPVMEGQKLGVAGPGFKDLGGPRGTFVRNAYAGTGFLSVYQGQRPGHADVLNLSHLQGTPKAAEFAQWFSQTGFNRNGAAAPPPKTLS